MGSTSSSVPGASRDRAPSGLEDDPELGEASRDARGQIEELKTQRAFIDEWLGTYQSARDCNTHCISDSLWALVRGRPGRRSRKAARPSWMVPNSGSLAEKAVQVRVRIHGNRSASPRRSQMFR